MKPTWASDDGSVRLYMGSNLEVLPQLAAASVQLTVTSPPYNLKKKWWSQGSNGCMPDLAAKFTEEWYDDELPEEEYQTWQRAVIAECERITDGSVCYNHKIRHAFKREGRTFHPIEWINPATLWCEIVWDKGNGTAINCRRPILSDERIFVIGRPLRWNNSGFTTVWRISPEQANGHPCPFPVEIPARLVGMFTDPGDCVLDPHMGSGTAGVACAQLGRGFVGIEKDATYFDLAKARIQEALGMEVKKNGVTQKRMFGQDVNG